MLANTKTMRKKLVATIHGGVQGVGYRFFARDTARRLGLAGFVRNQPDGSVLVCAEGEEELLRSLLEQLEQGPRHATVERVSHVWEEAAPDSGPRDFQVRY